MKISIIGSGYVGLVTGACLADRGHDVVCVDIDQSKVDAINAARSPFHEKGINEILAKNVGKTLRASTLLEQAVIETEITFIAAPTPFDGKAIELKYIKQIAGEIGGALKKKPPGHVVIVKSTVVPGTTNGVVREEIEAESGLNCGSDFALGMNPEFLSEGSAVEDFMNPDRIVLGGDSLAQDALAKVYASFKDVRKLRVSAEAAEMIKYASNSFQATMISFANEIANICSVNGDIDAMEVMEGVHLMKELRVGERLAPITNFLKPGCGFGGSCFPKDVKALVAYAKDEDARTPLLEAVLNINAKQPLKMIEMLRRKGFENLKGVRLAVLGLAFKPGTDDMRESPAIPIVNELIRCGAKVRAFDPVAAHEAKKIFPATNLTICDSLEDAIKDAEAILLVTRWPEFAKLPEILGQMQSPPLLIDGRRMIDKESVPRYAGIGL
jgi:UDPglucose 6-dehydrogenase/GDP-mannose 6-dehydrogenase